MSMTKQDWKEHNSLSSALQHSTGYHGPHEGYWAYVSVAAYWVHLGDDIRDTVSTPDCEILLLYGQVKEDCEKAG